MRSRERGWEAWERPSSSEGRGIWVCGGELRGAYRPGRSETNILGEVIFLVNRSEGPFFGERLHWIPPARPAKELGEKSGAQGGARLGPGAGGPVSQRGPGVPPCGCEEGSVGSPIPTVCSEPLFFWEQPCCPGSSP